MPLEPSQPLPLKYISLPNPQHCQSSSLNTTPKVHSELEPVKIAQLVKANTRKCGPSKWHMVLGSNLATDDTLNLPDVGYCGAVSTPRFGSPWRILRAWLWKVLRLSKKKKKVHSELEGI